MTTQTPKNAPRTALVVARPTVGAALAPAAWSRDPQFEQAALDAVNAKISKHTIKAYLADLERWLRFCYAMGACPANPGLAAATAFRDHLTALVSASSARRVISTMSYIYRTLLRGRVVAGNPFHPALLAWPVESRIGKTAAVDDATAEAMIAGAINDPNQAYGLRDAAVLRLLYDTGLRRASVAQLKRTTLRGNTIWAIVKGGKEVEVTLPPQTIAVLAAWLALAPESTYLFPGTRGPINEMTVNHIVKVRAEAVSAEGVHPHCFRAAFITAGYDAGLPEHEIQASAHHGDPRTTRMYDRGARGAGVADAVAKFRDAKKGEH